MLKKSKLSGILILSLFLTNNSLLYAQTEGETVWEISDSVKSFLIGEVTERILNYRLRENPEIAEEKYRIIRPNQIDRHYWSPRDVLFKKFLEDEYNLVLDVERWPEKGHRDRPYINYYLLTKKGNYFTNGKDTLTFPEYDQYDRHYPYDERFLVYYNTATKVFECLSGNFSKHRAWGNWYKSLGQLGAIKMTKIRLAQYNASDIDPILFNLSEYRDRVFDSLAKAEPEWYYFQVGESDLNKGASELIAKINQKWPYNNLEVFYFTNRPELTHDEDINHIYEVKYVFDYSKRGYFPSDDGCYDETLPRLRLLTDQDFKELRKKFKQPLLYFTGDLEGYDNTWGQQY